MSDKPEHLHDEYGDSRTLEEIEAEMEKLVALRDRVQAAAARPVTQFEGDVWVRDDTQPGGRIRLPRDGDVRIADSSHPEGWRWGPPPKFEGDVISEQRPGRGLRRVVQRDTSNDERYMPMFFLVELPKVFCRPSQYDDYAQSVLREVRLSINSHANVFAVGGVSQALDIIRRGNGRQITPQDHPHQNDATM